jgi:hypothetical protein
LSTSEGQTNLEKVKPDIIANICLVSKEEGSPRTLPISRAWFGLGCPIEYKGHKFDCKILLDENKIDFELGTCRRIPLKFLWPEGIVPRLKIGDSFLLWERGVIGQGTVTEILTTYVSQFEDHVMKYPNYLDKWVQEKLGKPSAKLKEEITVQGKYHPIGDPFRYAMFEASIEPADSFLVAVIPGAIPSTTDAQRYLDSAIFGILDIILATELRPLRDIKITITKMGIDLEGSSQYAFRRAGNDAGNKIRSSGSFVTNA